MEKSQVQHITNNSLSGTNVYTKPAISDDDILIFKWVILAGICQILDLFGIVTNIINIICFLKQGFKELINVSLLGLAISDLGALITLVAVNSFFTLAISAAEVPFEPLDVLYPVAALPHFAFSRVSTWITAIIIMERCLCILVPLKVKHVITSRRVTIVIASVFVILISSEAPVYFVNKLQMKFNPLRNKTTLGLTTTKDRESVQMITFTINNFMLPFTAFIIITVCTFVLVISLQRRTNWRKASTTTGEVSSRNQNVGKMVVMISTLFIVCFIPCAISMLAMAFEPGINLGGRHVNIGTVIFGIGLLMESVNSSTNIFIYYHMSTKYRETFRAAFCTYCDRDGRKA